MVRQSVIKIPNFELLHQGKIKRYYKSSSCDTGRLSNSLRNSKSSINTNFSNRLLKWNDKLCKKASEIVI